MIFQNENYQVIQIEPFVIESVECNYAVENLTTKAKEHYCATLPQAISVASQLDVLLKLAYENPEEIVEIKPKKTN